MTDFFKRNKPYIRPGLKPEDFITKLKPLEEKKFQLWVKKNHVPFDPSPKADYDMRGFWKGLQTGDSHATQGIDPNDKKMHFSDYWKTPYHQTFSNESRFATPDAPGWKGDKLIDKSGTVIFDDAAPREKAKPMSGKGIGMLVDIQNGIAKIFGHDGKWIDVPATRIPNGLKPGMDFHYTQSPRGHINIRPPADPTVSHATNSAKDRQMYAIKRLMSPGHGPDGKGWSLAQASGIVGRGMVESYTHLDTNASNPKDPGTSEGIFQWNGKRKDAMRAFTSKYDNKLDGQIDFFDHEILNSPSERMALVAMEHAKTPHEASLAMMHFERPGGYTPGAPQRGLMFSQTVKNAESLMGQFDPNYTPQVAADAPSGGGISDEDYGNTTVDAGGADQAIDATDPEDQAYQDAGQGISDAAGDYGAGGTVDTSASQAYINQMIQQGYNAANSGGYLPRLPTIEETFGNV